MPLRGKKDQLKVQTQVELEGDNNKTEKFKFVSVVKVAEVDEWSADWDRLQSEEEFTDAELVDKYLIDWENLKGDDGEQIEFTPENVAEALQIREYRLALVKAIIEANAGRAVLRAKN